MFTTLIVASLLAQQKPVYMCPTMNNRPTSKRMAVDHGSTRYYLCCDQCVRSAVTNGVAALQESAKRRDILIADVIFDPNSHLRVNEYKARFMLKDGYKMWLFESEDSQRKFEALTPRPKEPATESLACPVCQKTLKTTGDAYSYHDAENVRFYLDTKECHEALAANPVHTKTAAQNAAPVRLRPVPVPGIDW